MADSGSGQWLGDLLVTEGISHPVSLSLDGLGMTPDQVLPDFASFTSGTSLFDASMTAYEFTVDVRWDTVDIVLLPDPGPSVPTMGIGARALLILLMFAAGVGWMRLRQARP